MRRFIRVPARVMTIGCGTLLVLPLISGCDGGRSHGPTARLGIGRPATSAEIAAVNTDVNDLGAGLPPGSGTAAVGAPIFAQKCAVCHGANGEGIGLFPKLIGREPRQGFPFGRNVKLPHTIGNYWPYATTLYDYINRAMPQTAPGSLTPDQVYAVTAYLLARNEVIPDTAVMNATTLPRVKMPARDRFVLDDRGKGTEFR